MKAFARVAPFDVRQYIAHMIYDLRCNGADIPGVLPREPELVRSYISELAANAEASIEFIPVHQYAATQQLKACISKLEAFGAVSSDVRRQRALTKFHLSESRCKRVNRRVRWYRAHPERMSPTVRQLVQGMQHRIAVWLAEPMAFEEFESCGFGPGLTFGMTSQDRHIIYKICGGQTVTPRARQLATEVLFKLFPNWGAHLVSHGESLTHVQGNRITFVPKSYDIYRTIAVEPSLNVFLQNGIDKAIRRRMRPFGLTLDDQSNSINRMRENFASKEGCATIDLSSASDSVAREVVRWMLPPDWYRLIDTVRSPEYTLDKGSTWSTYEKFSSMGNGTTFPLESLIFYAAALECAAFAGDETGRVRVYGDDIVTSPRSALLLIELLRFLGFETNRDKTFIHGRFRECCGTDILDGVDVRPVFLRKTPKHADEVASLFNRLASCRYGFALGSTLTYLLSLVDKPLYGPRYVGSAQKTFLHPDGVEASVDEWYAGKCQLPDSYFFARQCTSVLRRSEKWHALFVKAHIWARAKDLVDRSGRRLTPEARYIGFLYGLGQRIYRPSSRLVIKSTTFTGSWPDPSPHQAVYDAIPETLPPCF